MSSAAFWSERVRRHGHTGWSDLATYAFDQRLRLKAVRELLCDVLSAAPAQRLARALDHGCGVGDFCSVLAQHVDAVVGYDPSPEVVARAAQLNAAANVRYGSSADEVWAGRYDLILSITVLQHVVDDTELQALVQRFGQALNPGGRIVVLETLAEVARDAGYLKRRTLAQLLAVFAAAGLEPLMQRGFYHPTECPTPAYRAYRQRWVVRGLARLAAWRVAPASALLKRIAQAAADADTGYLDQPESPTQLLVFGRGAA